MTRKIKNYFSLFRIKHYLKNVLIFLPLIFSGNFTNYSNFISIVFAFLSFSFITSVIYIINDICDIEKDKLHETKRNRPLASGKITKSASLISIFILMILSLIFLYYSHSFISIIYILIYIFINVLYSFGLKNIPILDVSILTLGFIIRILFGAAIINVEVSNWLYLTVMSMSFYLSLGKRRNEIIKSKSNTREVLKYYTKEFLDKNMYMCLCLTIVFYSLWSANYEIINKFNISLIWTAPMVILICMKYSMDIEKDSDGDPIETILKDKVLLLMVFLLGFFLISLIYIK